MPRSVDQLKNEEAAGSNSPLRRSSRIAQIVTDSSTDSEVSVKAEKTPKLISRSRESTDSKSPVDETRKVSRSMSRSPSVNSLGRGRRRSMSITKEEVEPSTPKKNTRSLRSETASPVVHLEEINTSSIKTRGRRSSLIETSEDGSEANKTRIRTRRSSITSEENSIDANVVQRVTRNRKKSISDLEKDQETENTEKSNEKSIASEDETGEDSVLQVTPVKKKKIDRSTKELDLSIIAEIEDESSPKAAKSNSPTTENDENKKETVNTESKSLNTTPKQQVTEEVEIRIVKLSKPELQKTDENSDKQSETKIASSQKQESPDSSNNCCSSKTPNEDKISTPLTNSISTDEIQEENKTSEVTSSEPITQLNPLEKSTVSPLLKIAENKVSEIKSVDVTTTGTPKRDCSVNGDSIETPKKSDTPEILNKSVFDKSINNLDAEKTEAETKVKSPNENDMNKANNVKSKDNSNKSLQDKENVFACTRNIRYSFCEPMEIDEVSFAQNIPSVEVNVTKDLEKIITDKEESSNPLILPINKTDVKSVINNKENTILSTSLKENEELLPKTTESADKDVKLMESLSEENLIIDDKMNKTKEDDSAKPVKNTEDKIIVEESIEFLEDSLIEILKDTSVSKVKSNKDGSEQFPTEIVNEINTSKTDKIKTNTTITEENEKTEHQSFSLLQTSADDSQNATAEKSMNKSVTTYSCTGKDEEKYEQINTSHQKLQEIDKSEINSKKNVEYGELYESKGNPKTNLNTTQDMDMNTSKKDKSHEEEINKSSNEEEIDKNSDDDDDEEINKSSDEEEINKSSNEKKKTEQNLSENGQDSMDDDDVESEDSVSLKLNRLIIEKTNELSDDSESVEFSDFIDDMAEECNQESSSIDDSNEIIDEGESIGSSCEKSEESDDAYENDSFIDDDSDCNNLLPGTEYRRIIAISDSSDDEDNNDSVFQTSSELLTNSTKDELPDAADIKKSKQICNISKDQVVETAVEKNEEDSLLVSNKPKVVEEKVKSIQKTININDIKDKNNLSEHISKVVHLLCNQIKNTMGEILSINVTVSYTSELEETAVLNEALSVSTKKTELLTDNLKQKQNVEETTGTKKRNSGGKDIAEIYKGLMNRSHELEQNEKIVNSKRKRSKSESETQQDEKSILKIKDMKKNVFLDNLNIISPKLSKENKKKNKISQNEQETIIEVIDDKGKKNKRKSVKYETRIQNDEVIEVQESTFSLSTSISEDNKSDDKNKTELNKQVKTTKQTKQEGKSKSESFVESDINQQIRVSDLVHKKDKKKKKKLNNISQDESVISNLSDSVFEDEEMLVDVLGNSQIEMSKRAKKRNKKNKSMQSKESDEQVKNAKEIGKEKKRNSSDLIFKKDENKKVKSSSFVEKSNSSDELDFEFDLEDEKKENIKTENKKKKNKISQNEQAKVDEVVSQLHENKTGKKQKKNKRKRAAMEVLEHNIEENISSKKKKISKGKISVNGTFPVNNTFEILDCASKNKFLPLKTSHEKEWNSESVQLIKPSASNKNTSNKEKKAESTTCSDFTVEKFHPKDYKNLILYNSNRVKRMSTKAMLKQKQKFQQ